MKTTPTIFQRGDIADDQGYPLPSTSANGGVNEGDYNYFYQEFFNADPHLDIADDAGAWLPSWGVNSGVNEGAYDFFGAAFFGDSRAFGRGVLSDQSIAFNRLGYAGYEWDPVLVGGYYHVRHRVYDWGNGRWTRRDPLGYVDGMGLEEYCSSGPVSKSDPHGAEPFTIGAMCIYTGIGVVGGAVSGFLIYHYSDEAGCTRDGLFSPPIVGAIECEVKCTKTIDIPHNDWGRSPGLPGTKPTVRHRLITYQ